MRSIRFFLFSVALVLLSTACSAPSPTAVPTRTLLAATSTPAPTSTPMPSATPRPSLTPTVTQTVPPTATFTATPDAALAEIKLIGLAWYSNYDMLLSFQFPGAVDPAAYRVTLEEKEYQCETIAQYPDRLYCRGQGARVLAVAWVRVYPAGSQNFGFEKQVWIPFFDNNYDSFYNP